jgi:hypothetical protein
MQNTKINDQRSVFRDQRQSPSSKVGELFSDD